MKTLTQLKRMNKDDLRTYGFDNFGIHPGASADSLKTEIISEILVAIKDAAEDAEAEKENARLDAEEAAEKILEIMNPEPIIKEEIITKIDEESGLNIIGTEVLREEFGTIKDEDVMNPGFDIMEEKVESAHPETDKAHEVRQDGIKRNNKASLNITVTKNEESKMKENFVIGSRDARLAIGSLKKAKSAEEATQPTPGVKAVAEVKDDDGVVTQEAVDKVKAIAGSPATPATLAVQKVFLIGNTDEIMDEVQARMTDQGFEPENDGQREYVQDCPRLTYTAENDKIIRAAFKKCKSKDGYNAPGLKIIADAKKVEDKKEADAKKEAAKETKEATPEKKETKKKVSKKKKEAEPKKEETDGWPGENFDA